MKGFLCRLLPVFLLLICTCTDVSADIRYEEFDVTVLCLLGAKDYCSTFEVIGDEEFYFYSNDFEIGSFPGSAGESDDFYLYFGLFVFATTSEQSGSHEKLKASVYAINLLDTTMFGFMIIEYSESIDNTNLWVPKSTGLALFWGVIDDD